MLKNKPSFSRSLLPTIAVVITILAVILLLPVDQKMNTVNAEATSAATDASGNGAQGANNTLFKYDTTMPLGIKEAGVEKRGDVSIHDVTFNGASSSDPVQAYIVTPAGSGPFAGILYVHWLGDPDTTNRTEFLDEAVSLASQGTVSVLVNAMWSQKDWYNNRVPENDYAMSIKQVIELRRALDVLVAQPGVDAKRIAYVGHDFGAMYGADLGGADQRPMAYVFMAGTPHFIDWMLFAAKPKDADAYKAQMATLDPATFVKEIKVPIFFQFAATDDYIDAPAAAEFYAAANAPKQMATYIGDHSLSTKDVAADRVSWLQKELGRKTS